MRLKVGLVDSDEVYVEKFVQNVQLKFPDEIELYVYKKQ